MHLLSPEEILVNAGKKEIHKDKEIKSAPFKLRNENLD